VRGGRAKDAPQVTTAALRNIDALIYQKVVDTVYCRLGFHEEMCSLRMIASDAMKSLKMRRSKFFNPSRAKKNMARDRTW
jgi:hypothetical protein